MEKSCKNCEFNYDGICTGNSQVYKYGEKILDETQFYKCWSANFEYYSYELHAMPRFLREKNHAGHRLYHAFDDYCAGKPVEINFFDAVKQVYGISMVDIAVLMDVSFGVVHRAKLQGIPQKRILQFSKALCVPPELLDINSTAVFEELEKTKQLFFAQEGIEQKLSAMPPWKNNLARTISQVTLKCPIHIAKELSRVDKFYWEMEDSMSEYTKSEQMFIEYVCKHTSKQLTAIEYQLDRGCLPHFSIRYVNY